MSAESVYELRVDDSLTLRVKTVGDLIQLLRTLRDDIRNLLSDMPSASASVMQKFDPAIKRLETGGQGESPLTSDIVVSSKLGDALRYLKYHQDHRVGAFIRELAVRDRPVGAGAFWYVFKVVSSEVLGALPLQGVVLAVLWEKGVSLSVAVAEQEVTELLRRGRASLDEATQLAASVRDSIGSIQNELVDVQRRASEAKQSIDKITEAAHAGVGELIRESEDTIKDNSRMVAEHRSIIDAHLEGARMQAADALNARVSQLNGEISALDERLKLEVEMIRKDVREAVALEEPLHYWEGEVNAWGAQVDKRWSTLCWVLGVIAVVAVGLLIIVVFGNPEVSPALVGLGIFLATVAFWGIGVATRVYMTALHVRRDAQERVVILKSYLSLIQSGRLQSTDEGLKTILATVFRPGQDAYFRGSSTPKPPLVELASRQN